MILKKILMFFAAFTLLVSIFIIIIRVNRPGYPAAEIVQKAFAAARARVASSEIYIRGTLKTGNVDALYEQQLLTSLIRQAGGNTEALQPVFFSFENDTGNGTESDYIINDNRSIHVSILNGTEGRMPDEYRDVLISLTDTSQRPELSASVKRLTGALESYGMQPDVNICMTGSMDGKLNDNELETVFERIFKSAGADKVEGMRDGGLVSVSAFSPVIDEAVRVNGKRINLNVAVRYNSYEGKTYIWLATPVITTEY